MVYFHILTLRRARRFPARHLSFFFATWYNGIPLGAKQGFAAPVRRYDMEELKDFRQEQEYTARVQQLMLEII